MPEDVQTLEAIRDLLAELLQEVRSIKKAISEPRLTYTEVSALARDFERKVKEADQQGHSEQATLYQGSLSFMREYERKMLAYIVEHMANELGVKPTNSNQASDISVEADAP